MVCYSSYIDNMVFQNSDLIYHQKNQKNILIFFTLIKINIMIKVLRKWNHVFLTDFTKMKG